MQDKRLYFYRRLSIVFATIPLILSFVVLVAWSVKRPELIQIIYGLPLMVPNSAIAIAIGSLNLLVGHRQKKHHLVQFLKTLSIILIYVIAISAFVEFYAQKTISINHFLLDFLYSENLSIELKNSLSTSPNSAAGFVLMATGLLLFDKYFILAQILSSILFVFGALALTGQAYHISLFYNFIGKSSSTGMSLMTSVSLIFISLSLLTKKASHGLLRFFFRGTMAKEILFRFSFAMMFVPFLFGVTAFISAGKNTQEVMYILTFLDFILLATFCAVIIGSAKAIERVEQKRDEKEMLLSQIIESLPIGIWLLDKNGIITSENEASKKIWAGSKYVGMKDFSNYRGQWEKTGVELKKNEWPIYRTIKTGEMVIGEMIRIHCFDGKRKVILNSAVPLKDAHGNFYGAINVNEDITERRNAEVDAEESAKQLLDAVQTREDVLSIVSHDLKNPLQAINLSIQYLKRRLPETKENESITKMLATIKSSAESMNRLIHGILDIGKIQAGTFSIEVKKTRLADILNNLKEVLIPLSKNKQIDLYFRPEDFDHEIECDPDRVMQIFSNLIGNAIKFTPAGGKIEVTMELQDHMIKVCVEDNGPGISKDLQKNLFNRYWQAKETSAQGSGLGLFITRGIVEAHGGEIWVESTPGAGTRFYFTIPESLNYPINKSRFFLTHKNTDQHEILH